MPADPPAAWWSDGVEQSLKRAGANRPELERALNASFLPKDIYLISRMPSDPQSSDIVPIALISLALSFVATLYPSWRASRVNPAEALRYE